MAKNTSKKKKSGGAAAKAGAVRAAQVTTSEGGSAATPPPAAASLGTRRGVRVRPEKVSAKEQSAIAKRAARAKWDERMTAAGR